jgi:hypothetical protein
MSTFDDREKGFEKKFALDAEQEFKAAARRNRLLGEWAAGLMGLESAEEYVRAVVKSDFEQPGDDDVLRKVFEDLKGSGVEMRESDVRMKMDELLAQAREQIKTEGCPPPSRFARHLPQRGRYSHNLIAPPLGELSVEAD